MGRLWVVNRPLAMGYGANGALGGCRLLPLHNLSDPAGAGIRQRRSPGPLRIRTCDGNRPFRLGGAELAPPNSMRSSTEYPPVLTRLASSPTPSFSIAFAKSAHPEAVSIESRCEPRSRSPRAKGKPGWRSSNGCQSSTQLEARHEAQQRPNADS